MKKFLLLSLSILGLHNAFGATITLTTSLSSPTFNSPTVGNPPTTLSTLATAAHYTLVPITATATSLTISSSSVFDNFGILYGPGGFFPSSPLSNALRSNDDKVGTNFGITRTVTIGTVYYLVVTGVGNADVGAVTITITGGTFGIPLPVSFSNISASQAGESNIIKWETTNEENCASFDIERSIDGINFNTIGTVNSQSKGISNTGFSYEFADTHPEALSYYRIKQFDNDGKFQISTTVKVNLINISNTLTIYPNPVSETIHFSTSFTSKSTIKVVDITGTILFTTTYDFSSTNTGGNLTLSNLKQGVYFLIVENKQSKSIQKFSKL